MTLITANYIKLNFPAWDHYAAYDTVSAGVDEALENQIEEAETELADYITVTEETITPQIKLHLRRIVEKNLFMLKHGDTEFERKPRILADYELSIQSLTKLRDGQRANTPPTPQTQQEALRIRSKARRYGPGNWFNDTGNYETDSREEQ